MATITDIAKLAGVSHGTVSNVLNKTGKVSTEKIRLVEEAAKQLGYVPNAQAQKLRQQSVNAVAMLLPNMRDNGYLHLFTATQQILFESGIELQVYITGDIPGQEERILERISSSALGAVITVSCLRKDLYARYSSLPCPILFINRPPEKEKDNFSFISFDFYQIGKNIADYILQHDWSRICLFSSPEFFHDCTQLHEGLHTRLMQSTVTLHWQTSDSNLAINEAFQILTDHDFDVIITTELARAEALESVLRITGKKKPIILTLDSYKVFSNHAVLSYQLNYYQMAGKISDALKNYLQKRIHIPKEIILEVNDRSLAKPFVKRSSKKTLTMLTLESPTTTALQQLLPLLEEKTGIILRITEMQYDDLYAQVNMLDEKFSYDMIRLDVAWRNKIHTDFFQPLDNIGIPQMELINSTNSHYTAPNGVFCALPFDPSVQILLYRTDLFYNATLKRAFYERFHKQLTIPKSIEDYMQVADFFTSRSNCNSPTLFGTACTCGTAVTAACDFLPFYLAQKKQNSDINGILSFSEAEMESALEQYARIAHHYSTEGNWWRDSVKSFSEGKTAMVSIFSNHASHVINSKYSKVVGKIGAAIMPGGRPLLGGGVIGISRFSKYADICKEFFRWYYSPEISSAIVRLGGTSPLMSAYENYENASIFPWLTISKDSFAIGNRGLLNEEKQSASLREYEFVIGTAVKNVVSRSLSPKEALQVAQHMYQSF